ncbi:cupin domain-containing protein [Streptomyces sp. NPDC058466]|uniref:cupin domain-containing protein n=1 Tax=Streptomyces sp. NPDC058466 TaxID=3346512 RepID=UPI0036538455
MDALHLSSELDFQDFISDPGQTEIIDSETFRDGQWRDLTRQSNFKPSVNKFVIPVNIAQAKFLVLTEVEGPTTVKSHAHSEPILRFVISGRFKLNGKAYSPGDWVYVPAGADYEISTEEGYTALMPYGEPCNPPA